MCWIVRLQVTIQRGLTHLIQQRWGNTGEMCGCSAHCHLCSLHFSLSLLLLSCLALLCRVFCHYFLLRCINSTDILYKWCAWLTHNTARLLSLTAIRSAVCVCVWAELGGGGQFGCWRRRMPILLVGRWKANILMWGCDVILTLHSSPHHSVCVCVA